MKVELTIDRMKELPKGAVPKRDRMRLQRHEILYQRRYTDR